MGTPPLLRGVQVYFGSGFVALLAVAGDVRMIVRGGIFGAQRIARHVWRMCTVSFVASGSFFQGQRQVFPPAVRNTPILPILTFLPDCCALALQRHTRKVDATRRQRFLPANLVSTFQRCFYASNR
jgi:hypothetical protein